MKGLVDALAESVPLVPAPPSSTLRERLLQRAASPSLRFAPFFSRLSQLFDWGDAQLAALFERAAAPGAFSPSPIPGVELLHLDGGPRVAHADNGLVRIAAGARFPEHRHLGLERVLVLAGRYRDEQSGQVYAAGDWHEMLPGTEHAYVVLPDAELLLAVSVVDGVDVAGYGTLSPSSSP